jgi:hypothetical protein
VRAKYVATAQSVRVRHSDESFRGVITWMIHGKHRLIADANTCFKATQEIIEVFPRLTL